MKNVQDGYLGDSCVYLCVIMHEIIFFIFVNFSIYFGTFEMKSQVYKIETF